MSFQRSAGSGKQKIDGFHVGEVEVHPGQTLKVDGFVYGDIKIHAGASVRIDGFVLGNIINLGGDFHINGFVLGRKIQARTEDDGLRVINPSKALAKTQAKLPAMLARLIERK
ncbi:hypothetical protein HQ393_07685 [Chitinibacter bivalviorum]|uniref:Polymer-forming cytoskeletal protein n=1 Tax=Chitinibacter bivalviorum TaxID=2739434 RepID=A0A7H9BIM9_9NEIS|nr:hypothetical protein [Chitinibacter bivalviorum]QLG88146.1 hypothetical protein HQ393_07685 [Chitinibacter bivalviorum]